MLPHLPDCCHPHLLDTCHHSDHWEARLWCPLTPRNHVRPGSCATIWCDSGAIRHAARRCSQRQGHRRHSGGRGGVHGPQAHLGQHAQVCAGWPGACQPVDREVANVQCGDHTPCSHDAPSGTGHAASAAAGACVSDPDTPCGWRQSWCLTTTTTQVAPTCDVTWVQDAWTLARGRGLARRPPFAESRFGHCGTPPLPGLQCVQRDSCTLVEPSNTTQRGRVGRTTHVRTQACCANCIHLREQCAREVREGGRLCALVRPLTPRVSAKVIGPQSYEASGRWCWGARRQSLPHGCGWCDRLGAAVSRTVMCASATPALGVGRARVVPPLAAAMPSARRVRPTPCELDPGLSART